MWWFFVGLAFAQTAVVGEQAEGLPLQVTAEEPWEIDADSALLQVDVKTERGSIPIASDSLSTSLPVKVFSMVGDVTSVALIAHFKACRKDTGVCKPFTVQGETDRLPATVSLRAYEGDASAIVQSISARVEEQRQAKERGSDGPSMPAYDDAMNRQVGVSLREARARAAERGVPLLAIAGFKGCEPCSSLARDVLFAADDPAGLARVEWVLLNQQDPSGTDELRALGLDQGAPSLALLRGEQIVAEAMGYTKPSQLSKWLDTHLDSSD